MKSTNPNTEASERIAYGVQQKTKAKDMKMTFQKDKRLIHIKLLFNNFFTILIAFSCLFFDASLISF